MSAEGRNVRLEARRHEVLEAVVRRYTANGEPVGSKVVAETSREGLSPATIRHLMAQLEEDGLLSQPHTSAGRIPTDKGYRRYVDRLVRDLRIMRSDQTAIDRRMQALEGIGVEELLERVAEMLSGLSRNVAILLSPAAGAERLRHISFVRLPGRRILVVLVSGTAQVKDCIVRAEEDFSQEELDRMSRYLLDHFAGKDLITIRNDLVDRMHEERNLYRRAWRQALSLCEESLRTCAEGPREVFVDGTAHFIRKPDFSDLQRLSELCAMFAQKERLVRILSDVLGAESELQVRIGAESGIAAMRDCAIITARYAGLNAAIGHVGVVGPMRMPYDRMIPVVAYVASSVERILRN
ncbi:MAG: heat-inducible transcription repressor HrcA [Acidobacteria bacterium]|nr:heat-inducible transcription repressor HrcA [Acidobacteriota bacterium]